MREKLRELAEKLGICTSFTYNAGGEKTVEPDDGLLAFFVERLGYNAKTENGVEESLKRLEKKRWQRAMEAVYTVNAEKKEFDIVLSKKEAEGGTEVLFATEGTKDFAPLKVSFEAVEERSEGRTDYVRYTGKIEDELDFGYYDIKVKTLKGEYKTVLAVCPSECFKLDKKGKDKLWGFAVQLYALKSRRNWGVGDFTDLGNLAELAGKDGGDVIGLNPLSVLDHNYPENASPYSSVSRLFLNPIYIDVEKVPFYEDGDKDEDTVLAVKEKEHIDYTAIYSAKIRTLKSIFLRARADKKSAYWQAFEAFKAADTGELKRLCVYEALSEERVKVGHKAKKEWDAQYGSVLAGGVEKFAAKHRAEIDFFAFLQFEADRQLKDAVQKISEADMAIGLYRDLPVGVSKDSAEVWGDKYLYMQDCGAGAPPDGYFPTGQKWGLGAFNPTELKERCYKPFIRILRANMRYAGAIRIDHIMGLSRLYVIPDKGEEGTYIRYNQKDMMNILALESHLNRCVVVGECIGNVESGFQEMLVRRNIYSLGVLWGERRDGGLGAFRMPDEYERKYFASIGTHDMAPLKARWFGTEIGTMRDLGFYSAEETQEAYHGREYERRLLLQALDAAGVWPDDRQRRGDYLYGESFPEGLEEAAHGFMAKAQSEVFMLQPEDIFGSMKIQNLPGTDIDKYPNWRSRLDVDLEDMAESEAYQRNIAVVKRWR